MKNCNPFFKKCITRKKLLEPVSPALGFVCSMCCDFHHWCRSLGFLIGKELSFGTGHVAIQHWLSGSLATWMIRDASCWRFSNSFNSRDLQKVGYTMTQYTWFFPSDFPVFARHLSPDPRCHRSNQTWVRMRFQLTTLIQWCFKA